MLPRASELAIYFQYPVCDLRNLIEDKSLVKPLPNWKKPLPNRHFLPYFGHLKERKKGGHDYFHDEYYYIGGRGGLKFDRLETVHIDGLGPMDCIYRRILNDKVAGIRYEFGLGCDDDGWLSRLPTEGGAAVRPLADALLGQIPLFIKNLNKTPKPTTILHAGKSLARLYVKSSGNKELKSFGSMVKNGEVGVFIEYPLDELNDAVSLTDSDFVLEDGAILSHQRITTDGTAANVFLLGRKGPRNDPAFRNTRISLMRMYFEHQVLSLVLAMFDNPRLTFDHDVLDRYLLDKVKFFHHKKKKGRSQRQLHNLIFSFVELIPSAKVEILKEGLADVRLQIKKRVWEHLAEASTTFRSEPLGAVGERVKDLIRQDELSEALDQLSKVFPPNSESLAEVLRLQHHLEGIRQDEGEKNLGWNELNNQKNQLAIEIMDLVRRGLR